MLLLWSFVVCTRVNFTFTVMFYGYTVYLKLVQLMGLLCTAVVSCVDPAGNVCRMLYPGGTELGTQVKIESGRPHTLSVIPK